MFKGHPPIPSSPASISATDIIARDPFEAFFAESDSDFQETKRATTEDATRLVRRIHARKVKEVKVIGDTPPEDSKEWKDKFAAVNKKRNWW